MKTFSKVLLTSAVIAVVGAGAAMARMHERGPGPGGPFGGGMGEQMYAHMCTTDSAMNNGAMNNGGMNNGAMNNGHMNGAPMDGSKMADRLTKKLSLTDPQKTALADLQTTFAKTHDDAKTALCADKPDFKTVTGRMAFGIKAGEIHLNGAKMVQPKLEAFYATLTDAQKKTFDEIGPGHRGEGRHHKWMKKWMHGDEQMHGDSQ